MVHPLYLFAFVELSVARPDALQHTGPATPTWVFSSFDREWNEISHFDFKNFGAPSRPSLSVSLCLCQCKTRTSSDGWGLRLFSTLKTSSQPPQNRWTWIDNQRCSRNRDWKCLNVILLLFFPSIFFSDDIHYSPISSHSRSSLPRYSFFFLLAKNVVSIFFALHLGRCALFSKKKKRASKETRAVSCGSIIGPKGSSFLWARRLDQGGPYYQY